MEEFALRKATANGDAHVRLGHGTHALGNLAIRIVCGRLDVHIGAPVADIGGNSHDDAPRTAGNIGLSRLPTALSPGQYFRARLSLTIATGRELAVSRPSKARPWSSGICSVRK